MEHKKRKIEVTVAQAGIVEAVRALTANFGYPPTVSEIAGAVGYSSPNAAMEHIHRLVLKGVLSREENKARTLKVVSGYTVKIDKKKKQG